MTTSDLFTSSFWLTTIARTVRGAAASALTTFGIGTTPIVSVPWYGVLAGAGVGAITSLLTCLTEIQVTKAGAKALGLLSTTRNGDST